MDGESIVSALPYPAWLHRGPSRRLACPNDAACELLGCRKGEETGLEAADLGVNLDAMGCFGPQRTTLRDQRGGAHPVRLSVRRLGAASDDVSLAIAEPVGFYESQLARERERVSAMISVQVETAGLEGGALMQRAMEIVENLTDSSISFIHLVHDDQESIELVAWSRRTLQDFCAVATPASHYPLRDAGIWADAMRQRRPVVFDDYEHYPYKHGLPEGHAALERILCVPVLEGDTVRMITGVGNKHVPYDDFDVESVQLLSNQIWALVKGERQGLKVRAGEFQNRTIIEQAPDPILVVREGVVQFANGSAGLCFGDTASSCEQFVGRTLTALFDPADREEVERCISDALASGRGVVDSAPVRPASADRRLLVRCSNYLHARGRDVLVFCRDVSSSLALAQQTSLLSALTAALPDLLLRIAPDGTVLEFDVSPGVADYGSAADAVGRQLPEILPPAPAARFQQAIEDAIASGEMQTFEYTLAREDRELVREARVAATSAASSLVAVVRDITADRDARSRLRNRMSDLHALYEFLRVLTSSYIGGSGSWNAATALESVAPRLVSLLGDALRQAGKGTVELCFDGAHWCSDPSAVLAPAPEPLFDAPLQVGGAAPGRLVFRPLTAAVVGLSPEHRELLAACADNLCAWLAWHESQSQLRIEQQAFEHALDLLAVVDRQLAYILVNGSYARLYGYERQEMRGVPVAEVVGSELFEALVRPKLTRALAGETVSYSSERRFRDGRERTIDFTYTPLWREGEIIGVVASGRDVSEVLESMQRFRTADRREPHS